MKQGVWLRGGREPPAHAPDHPQQAKLIRSLRDRESLTNLCDGECEGGVRDDGARGEARKRGAALVSKDAGHEGHLESSGHHVEHHGTAGKWEVREWRPHLKARMPATSATSKAVGTTLNTIELWAVESE